MCPGWYVRAYSMSSVDRISSLRYVPGMSEKTTVSIRLTPERLADLDAARHASFTPPAPIPTRTAMAEAIFNAAMDRYTEAAKAERSRRKAARS